EDVVRDLKRDAEREPERAGAAAEQTGRLEQLPRLEAAALEVRLDRRVGIMSLCTLHRLAAGETERRLGEDRDRTGVTCRRKLLERAGEQVIAGGARG